MIEGMHAMFYTEKPDELRDFFRDKLELPATDVGDGWLVFDVPEADFGCHPAEEHTHGISFYCENLERTVDELEDRGVEFTEPIEDQGWGRTTKIRLPDGAELQLYEPKYDK